MEIKEQMEIKDLKVVPEVAEVEIVPNKVALLDTSDLEISNKEEEFNIFEWIKGIKILERFHFYNPVTKKMLSNYELTILITEKSLLNNSLIFPSMNEYYVYDYHQGIYIKYDEVGFKVIIGTILDNFSIPPEYRQVSTICNNFKVGKKSRTNDVQTNIHNGMTCFSNCVLNLRTGISEPHSPKYFLTTRLDFEYQPDNQTIPNFMSYINNLCDGHEDRVPFLRSWFWLIINNVTSTQTFLYMLGRGRTGKSIFGHICTALVGKKGSVVTSLRSLNNDPFEVYNLKDMLLIIISDTEHYKGDLAVLKQVVSGDPLKARVKFMQGSYDIYPKGLVLIIGNHGLGSQDSSGAIERRLRLFTADKVIDVKDTKPLLYNHQGEWKGLLAPELPGIFNWIYHFNETKAISYMENTLDLVPSLKDEILEGYETLNPIKNWVEEELEQGEGAYLGFHMKDDDKTQMEDQKRGLIFPAYVRYCKKRNIQPITHVLFSRELLSTCKTLQWDVTKQRRKEGVYIQGIKLSNEIFDRDRIYGGSINSLSVPSVNEDVKEVNLVSSFPVPNDIYTPYMDLLDKTPLKTSMNKWIRTNTPTIESLLDEYFQHHKEINPIYKEHIANTFSKGIETIKTYGAIPYKYKRMGTSPRILPVNYGKTINNTKRILRNQVYSLLSRSPCCEGYSILDLDLKSCYTSILLGLYPSPLQSIQLAIENRGLWNYIEDEFKGKGMGHLYNKKFVKICVYSSFFLGGTKAMMEGIMDSVREDIGVTKDQWKNHPLKEETYSIAQNITQEMMNSSIIVDFQSIAQYIKNVYLNEHMIGPSGQSYLVTENNFRNVYPNWLQSYEITLLSVPFIELVKLYPSVEIIGHYHDGNVIMCKTEDVESVITYYNKKVTELGFQLGLKYKQELEVKAIFK